MTTATRHTNHRPSTRHWLDANGKLTKINTPRGPRYQHEGGSLIQVTDETLLACFNTRVWYPGQVVEFAPYHVQLVEYFPEAKIWLASVIR